MIGGETSLMPASLSAGSRHVGDIADLLEIRLAFVPFASAYPSLAEQLRMPAIETFGHGTDKHVHEGVSAP